jgi:hypothetical protein
MLIFAFSIRVGRGSGRRRRTDSGTQTSAIAEKHYRRRPLDLLPSWDDRLKPECMEHAGIAFEPDADWILGHEDLLSRHSHGHWRLPR